MITKQQIAATLLNHKFVVNQSLELKTISRMPSGKYFLITNETPSAEVQPIVESLMIYNRKHLLENIERVFINHPVISKLNGPIATDTSKKKSARFIIKIPKNLSPIYENITYSLDHLSQNNNIRDMIIKLRENFVINADPSGVKELYLEVNVMDKEWYFSMPFVYSKFIDNLNAIGKFISLFDFIDNNLPKKEKIEVYERRAYLIFEDDFIKPDMGYAIKYKIIETEEARIQKEMKRKLSEAAKKRTKKVVNLVEKTGENSTVSYIFEDGTQPLIMNIDVITQW